MTEPAIPAGVERLNDRFAITSLGSFKKSKAVVEFGDDGVIDSVWDFADFRQHLIHERVQDGNSFVPAADYWLAHPDARRYDRLVFAPRGSGVKVGERDYQTWRGFSVAPVAGEWSFLRFHIEDVICAGNATYAHWLHNWIAALVQRPGEHGWVAPLLKGGQGTGKGFFATHMLGGLFRPVNFAHLTDPKHLTSDFNGYLENRVLAFGDEAFWGNAGAANKLKGLITENSILINRKHMPQEFQTSCLHIVIASNADKPLPVERDDRRLFVLEVSEEFKSDAEYFRGLRHDLDNGGRAAMLAYYLSVDVDWDLLKRPPESTAKTAMKIESLDPIDQWWLDVLSADTWRSTWACGAAAEHCVEWFNKFQGRGPKPSTRALGIYLSRHFERGGMAGWPKLVKTGPRDSRVNAWQFPELGECRRAFDRATGTTTPWESAGG